MAYNSKGRFIIGTNIINRTKFPDLDIVEKYQKRSQIETNFQFIKDSTFLLDEVYLKCPKRIQALLCVMCLSLFTHNLGQKIMREKLAKKKIKVPDQKGKLTIRPTLKWIYHYMTGISLVTVRIKNRVYQEYTNITSFHERIISVFGKYARNIYGFS